jgi:hypothetical protein
MKRNTVIASVQFSCALPFAQTAPGMQEFDGVVRESATQPNCAHLRSIEFRSAPVIITVFDANASLQSAQGRLLLSDLRCYARFQIAVGHCG